MNDNETSKILLWNSNDEANAKNFHMRTECYNFTKSSFLASGYLGLSPQRHTFAIQFT